MFVSYRKAARVMYVCVVNEGGYYIACRCLSMYYLMCGMMEDRVQTDSISNWTRLFLLFFVQFLYGLLAPSSAAVSDNDTYVYPSQEHQ